MNEPTAAPRTYVLGDEFHLPKVHVPKKKAAPIFTEERRSAWDTIRAEDRARIQAERGRLRPRRWRRSSGRRGGVAADPKADRYLQDGRAGVPFCVR